MDSNFVTPPELSQHQRSDVKKYLTEHPEIKQIIQELIEAVIAHKPEKPLEFVAEYFNNLK